MTNPQQLSNGKLAPFIQTLPSRLLALRKAHGLTQKETGELMGVSSYAVNQWERGAIPNSPNRQRLLDLFDEYEAQEPKQAEPTPEFEFLSKVKPKMFIIERPGLAPLRFKGVELGTILVGMGSVTLYETVGGSYVWDAGQELVESGDAKQPVDWGTANDFKQFALGFSSNSTDDLLALANEHGLEIFEDIE